MNPLLRSPLQILGLTLCLAAPLAACDGDDGDPKPDTSGTADVADTSDTSEADTSYEFSKDPTGTTFRVDSLALATPEDLAPVINDLWVKDIEANRFILLFHVKSFDAATGAAEVEVGTGKLEADTFSWGEPPSVINLNFVGGQFTTVGDAQIELNPATVSKPIIVSTLDVVGAIDQDVLELGPASLTGSITKANAEGLDVLLDPDDPENSIKLGLVELLEGAEVPLTVDTDGDGTPDAWSLSGTLTGKAVTNVDFSQ